MNTLIDTHCHITCDALYERIDEVLENARQAGIEKMLIICTDFTEYERAQQLRSANRSALISHWAFIRTICTLFRKPIMSGWRSC